MDVKIHKVIAVIRTDCVDGSLPAIKVCCERFRILKHSFNVLDRRYVPSTDSSTVEFVCISKHILHILYIAG